MSTTEYRFEFLIEPDGEWFRMSDVCYDLDSAIKRFNETLANSAMEWRLIEEVIASRVVAQNKGGAE